MKDNRNMGVCSNCGDVVILENFTNPCDCGRDYDRQGNLLAPRKQWGAETGETWQDVMEVDR